MRKTISTRIQQQQNWKTKLTHSWLDHVAISQYSKISEKQENFLGNFHNLSNIVEFSEFISKWKSIFERNQHLSVYNN